MHLFDALLSLYLLRYPSASVGRLTDVVVAAFVAVLYGEIAPEDADTYVRVRLTD